MKTEFVCFSRINNFSSSFWTSASISNYFQHYINYNYVNGERERYEEDLARRQKEHLEKVNNFGEIYWKPCLHDSCPSCIGTGVKIDGSACVHMLSCSCPKCSPHY